MCLFTICISILNFQLLSCCMATACCWDGSQAAVEAEVDMDAPPVEGPALDPREELKEWPEFVSCLATNYQIPSHEVCFDSGNFLDFRLQEFQWWWGGFSVFPFFQRLTKEVSGAVQFWGIKVEPTDRWWGSWTVLKPLGVQQPGRSHSWAKLFQMVSLLVKLFLLEQRRWTDCLCCVWMWFFWWKIVEFLKTTWDGWHLFPGGVNCCGVERPCF